MRCRGSRASAIADFLWRASEVMTKQFQVSTVLPRKLQELGLSPEEVLRRAGLPIGLFSLEKILVSTEEFFALQAEGTVRQRSRRFSVSAAYPPPSGGEAE